MKKRTNEWMKLMLIVIIVLPAIVIVALWMSSPDTFITEKVVKNGIKLNIQYEKIFDTYITWLAAFAPFVLGVVAISQSEQLQKLEKRNADRNDSSNIYIEDYIDNKLVAKCKVLTNDLGGKYESDRRYIYIEIENFSDAFLKEIEIKFGTIKFHSYITLAKGIKKQYKIYLPKRYVIDEHNKCDIVFTSCYDVETYADFVINDWSTDRKGIKYYHFYGTEKRN